MAKTKISEFSSTPSNNTDINGINIAEGCAPSGINNAIRQLMSELKDFQTGAMGDDFAVGGNLTVTGTTSLTGVATAPTAVAGTNTTQVATTAFVTSALSGKPSDPGTNGIAVRTALNTLTARSIATGSGLSVTNGDGVAGNPTVSMNYANSTTIGGVRVAVSGTTLNIYTS